MSIKRNKSKINRRSFVFLVFISSVATTTVGDRLPLSFFPEAFPVFAELGAEVEGMADFSAIWGTPTLIETLVATEDGIDYTPTVTPTPTFTATPLTILSPAPTVTPAHTSTPLPPPEPATVTPMPTSTPVDCPGIMPSRLSKGMKVVVTKNLNLRSSPEAVTGNLIRTNLTGTELEIMGEPVCVPDPEHPYLWWQVRTPDGLIGWSVEASASGTFYFMKPIE
jgi:hypothetical protein